MAPGSLSPAFVKVAYHSAFAPHFMIIPTNEAVALDVAFASLEIQTWNSDHISLQTMLTALLTEMLPRFPSSVAFDNYTFFSQPTPEDLPIPIGSAALTLTGSSSTPGYDKATQETIVMRDTGSHIVKLVLLDFASGNEFGKFTNAATIGVDGIVDEFTAVTNGWRSRKDLRPATFVARTATLNEKLRKAYRQT